MINTKYLGKIETEIRESIRHWLRNVFSQNYDEDLSRGVQKVNN